VSEPKETVRKLPAGVKAATERALTWLYDTEQPADALVMPAGRELTFGNTDLSVGVRPGVTGPTLVLSLPRPGQSLNRAQWDEWQTLVAKLAKKHQTAIARTFNGPPTHTGAVVLDAAAHPTLVAAVQRFQAGCPWHRGACRDEGCSWYSSGARIVVNP
jgi:hypothetical protein